MHDPVDAREDVAAMHRLERALRSPDGGRGMVEHQDDGAHRQRVGLVRPDRALDGDGVHVPPRDRAIGVAFQDPSLLPWRDVRKNIRLPLEVLGRKVDQAEIDKAIELVGLKGFEGKYPWQLSGGMMQRALIVDAMSSYAAVAIDARTTPFDALVAEGRVRYVLMGNGGGPGGPGGPVGGNGPAPAVAPAGPGLMPSTRR